MSESTAREIAERIDHTLLKPNAGRNEIARLCNEAIGHHYRTVCVNPTHVRFCVYRLAHSKINVAAVVGFPLGANCTEIKVAETKLVVDHGGTEIDMVINVGMLLDEKISVVKDEIAAVVLAAGGLPVKVILEMNLLNQEAKVRGVEVCIAAHAAMVKTCTGFADGSGATVEDVTLIKGLLGGTNLGIKASKGIRTLKQARELLDAGANRLGIGQAASLSIVQEALAEV
jgi:deoxyribose-phosphate aldolase